MHLWCVWKDRKPASFQQDLKPLGKCLETFLWMIVFEHVGVVLRTFAHYRFSRSRDPSHLVTLRAKHKPKKQRNAFNTHTPKWLIIVGLRFQFAYLSDKFQLLNVIFTGEKCLSSEYLHEYTTNRPNINSSCVFRAVEKQFRCTVPSRHNILSHYLCLIRSSC